MRAVKRAWSFAGVPHHCLLRAAAPQRTAPSQTLWRRALTSAAARPEEGEATPTFSWARPEGRDTGVRLWNSLTGSETPLVTTSPTDALSWYTCGPTVYDVSHLGHARTYVTVDIMLRTLREYFGVNTWHVLNITDVDDKIIKRANEAGVSALELSQRFEREFFHDMAALGVEPPATVVRVSDHMPEVVDFIRELEGRGLAYATPSGVYFDSLQFTRSHRFRMAPSFSDGAESGGGGGGGEGGEETGSPSTRDDKRNPRDFALWKAAKAGEPSWASPWGHGRPGWHIECSAMCTSLFGGHLDVHAGGIDLKFPHHCNEVAQCEAYLGTHQWGNYFVHIGHLHIAGLKMSKSLKNFVSIRDFLRSYTGRQFRMFCLLHGYGRPVDYSEEHMQHSVLPVEKRLDDFRALLHARLRQAARDGSRLKWGDAEKALQHEILSCEHAVKERLACNLDTEGALGLLLQLITRAHAHLQTTTAPQAELLASLVRAVDRPLRVFGILDRGDRAAMQNHDHEDDEVDALLDTLALFRQQVRKTAISSARVKQDVLALCDRLRDHDLPVLGYKLEDDPKTGSLWKRTAS